MEIKVGDRFTTNKGGDVVVVEYVKAKNIIVEFVDSHRHRVVTTRSDMLRGRIKNPFVLSVYGVGYIGVGEYKSSKGPARLGFKRTESYVAWKNMLCRCYYSGYNNPELYAHVSVDSKWHNYQVFAEWYTKQIRNNKCNGKLCLDKDILTDDFVYSASTCCVVPDAINKLVKSSKGGEYLPGIKSSSKKGYHMLPNSTCSNTVFSNEIEAHLAFVQARVNKIKEAAIQYKDQIDIKVFNALMTRDFRYKFSPLFEPETKVTLH